MGCVIPAERQLRRAMNPVSTSLTEWWCHSALRRQVLRRGEGGVVTKRKFRHYADGEPPAEGPKQPDRPRDGQGTIWVSQDHDGHWSASWQDGPRIQNTGWSTKADAIK